MRPNHLATYVLVAAILITGLAVAGVPLSVVLPLMLAVACPLMMIGMGHGGELTSHDRAGHSSR